MAGAKKELKVTGAAAVLRTQSGTERYLYRGAPVSEGEFTDESVKNAIAAGLVSKVESGKPAGQAGTDEGAYKNVGVAELKATIETRNKDRAEDKKIVPAAPGNRSEIVAALLADDAAAAAA